MNPTLGQKIKIFHSGQWIYAEIVRVTHYPADKWSDKAAYDRCEIVTEQKNESSLYAQIEAV